MRSTWHPLQGFTLIEMLACMTLVLVLFSLAATGSRRRDRSIRLRNAGYELKSGLDSARQRAMTRQTETQFSMAMANDRAWYWITDSRPDGGIGMSNALPSGIIWTSLTAPPPTAIHFKPSGALQETNDRVVGIGESSGRAAPLHSEVYIYRATGHTVLQ